MFSATMHFCNINYSQVTRFPNMNFKKLTKKIHSSFLNLLAIVLTNNLEISLILKVTEYG